MKLEEIYKKYSKHCDKGTIHSYISFYEKAFGFLQDDNINLLEIGVQSGDCLLMWADYFKKGHIYGVDISDCDKKHERVSFLKHNATASTLPENYEKGFFDIIIDDASHKPIDQMVTLALMYDKLKDGGWYFIEDIQDIGSFSDMYKRELELLSKAGKVCVHKFITTRYDDVIIEIRRGHAL